LIIKIGLGNYFDKVNHERLLESILWLLLTKTIELICKFF